MSTLTPRDLLVGALAAQAGLVPPDDLLDAWTQWRQDRTRPLAEALAGRGRLSPRLCDRLQGLAMSHLACLQTDPVLRGRWEALLDDDSASGVPTSATNGPARRQRAVPDATPAMHAAPADARGRPGGRRYTRLGLHARGGLGAVYHARDEELDRAVALKEIQPKRADDPASRARFVFEAEVTGRLEHPGVVPVYGLSCYEDGRPFYAMRFVQGLSLAEAIKLHHRTQKTADDAQRGLALRGLLGRFVTVCNTVEYAHSRGILHRDLKPANVMLGDYGETLVIDWGLAKLRGAAAPASSGGVSAGHSSGTQEGDVVGTPGYMAPEQARGRQDEVGPASDVYSLGATLAELLSGWAPMEAERGNLAGWLAENRVPAALAAVCGKAMAARPADRYGSARGLAEEVERWLADEPVGAYREPAAVRLRRWGRRHRTAVAAAVALLLAGVVGLSLGLWAVQRQRAETARQRDEAEENLKLAKQAVDECFGLAKDHPLLQAENLRQVRRLLYEKTLPFYKNFRARDPNDPALAFEQANYLYRVGVITAVVGSKTDAIASLEQSRDVLGRLVEARPEEADYQAELAKVCLHLGAEQQSTGRNNESRESFLRSRDVLLGLVEAHPDAGKHRASLAVAWRSLAIVSGHKEALECYRQALRLLEELEKTDPGVGEYQAELAGTWNNLANLQSHAGQSRESLRSYTKARDVLAGLAKARPEVSRYRYELAVAWNNLASQQRATAQPAETLRSYAEARGLLDELTKAQPDVRQYRAVLASTCGNLGLAQQEAGQNDRALESLTRARDLQLALTKGQPEVRQHQSDLARTWGFLGTLQAKTGRPKEGLGSHAKARDILEALVKADPEDVPSRAELAQTWSRLSLAEHSLKDHQRAAGSNARARELLGQLVRERPEALGYQADLGAVWVNLSLLQREAGKLAEALDSLGRAIALLEAVRRRMPEHPAYRQWHRNAHGSRAETLAGLGRHRDAVADWDEALRLSPDPGRRGYFRSQRAVSLACVGDHAAAVAQVDQLNRDVPVPGAALYPMAQAMALAAAAARRDADRPLPEREKNVEQWSRRAVNLLRRAQRAGYFRLPANVEILHKDPALDALRQRDDFGRWLQALP